MPHLQQSSVRLLLLTLAGKRLRESGQFQRTWWRLFWVVYSCLKSFSARWNVIRLKKKLLCYNGNGKSHIWGVEWLEQPPSMCENVYRTQSSTSLVILSSSLPYLLRQGFSLNLQLMDFDRNQLWSFPFLSPSTQVLILNIHTIIWVLG